MVDIHSHILPFLDDGAETMEEAVNMAYIAAKNGINHIVASSHGNYYPYTIEEYRESFKQLQKLLSEKKIPVKLYPGMEIFMDECAISLIEQKKVLSVNETNYLLIEFPFEEKTEKVCKYIANLQMKKYNVILAHPERYIFMQNDPELAYYLEETGCILQVNRGSILGEFGRNSRRLALQMLNDGIIKVIGTDAHDTEYRPPSVGKLLNFLRNNYSSRDIHLWLSENPSRIIKGYPVL
ncbi:tyrosine-protein phosphatase [Blautia sp.]